MTNYNESVCADCGEHCEVTVPQFHHWLQQLINEDGIESDD